MTEALMGTCILAVTTIIFVWVCSEYQIYNNELQRLYLFGYVQSIRFIIMNIQQRKS